MKKSAAKAISITIKKKNRDYLIRSPMYNKIHHSMEKLRGYCEREQFKGWDPYDGLNSLIFRYSPLKLSRFIRLAWIQFFKQNPFNLRPLFLVKKGYNSKGLALFLSSYCNFYKIDPSEKYLKIIGFLADKLLESKTKGFSGDCWGYNFDWQSRLEFMPKNTPTTVVTSFAAYGLMDAYECTKNKKYLHSALGSCNFIINDINRSNKEKGFIFSYSPLDKMRVYNASLLGSRMLARAYSYNGNEKILDIARESIIACVAAQREDGSWLFGEDKAQNWVDSFHTGYKLESISEYQKYSGDTTFDENIKKGTNFYLNNFFLKDGTPKYYDKEIYPIDIHCPAQFVAALSRLNIFFENIDLIEKVLSWTIKNMQDIKRGYFYYQIKKYKSSKIPYIRWGQAWMLYGMSFYLLEKRKNGKNFGS